VKILDNQLDKPSLSKFGEDACRLFVARDFRGLADTFGYALAYNREIASAIEADFEHCLSGNCTSRSEHGSPVESITVRSFQPNDTGLLWVIECVLLVDKSARVLIELIVAKNGENKNLYLEDINAMANPSPEPSAVEATSSTTRSTPQTDGGSVLGR
jgi:hypothetical protein